MTADGPQDRTMMIGGNDMKVYEGKLVSQDMKIGIVAARFNEFIVSKLQATKRANIRKKPMPYF